jgi:hypothetical protein
LKNLGDPLEAFGDVVGYGEGGAIELVAEAGGERRGLIFEEVEHFVVES